MPTDAPQANPQANPQPNPRPSDAAADPNTALVRRFYALAAAGDFDALRREVLAPDVVWRIPGRNPLAGEKRGADEVIAWLRLLGRTEYQMELQFLQSDGRHVVEIHHGRGRHGDAVVDCSNSAIYTVRGGRLAEVQNHTSDQYALDAFYLSYFTYAPLPGRVADA